MSESKKWSLEPETEYRFELDPKTTLAVKLIDGTAEVFGSELAEGKTYLFGAECKAAIFTWKGCTIEISKPSVEYISDETPMIAYMNLFLVFERMRVLALRAERGSLLLPGDEVDDTEPTAPRILVLGPENSGKTTACKILANYSVRSAAAWAPVLVNVDPSEGGWTVPGTISSCSIDMPIQTFASTNLLGISATSAPTALSSSALVPLVYWYGHAESKRNPELMDRLIRNLGDNVSERFHDDSLGRVSGVIIDTPSSFANATQGTSEDKYSLIKACIDAFHVNIILVMGHEKLTVEMNRIFGQRDIKVLKIPKSGGVVELDDTYRERVHAAQLHNYFYGQRLEAPPDAVLGGEGLTELVLHPHSFTVGFDDLQIYRIGEESMAPSSALPIGASRTLSELQPIRLDPATTSGLLNSVLALLAPLNPDESERYDEEILDLHVIGFLVVTAIDKVNSKMTILAPSQGSVAGRVCVMGSFEWQDR